MKLAPIGRSGKQQMALLAAAATVIAGFADGRVATAAQLAAPTYDTDSYVFVGTNSFADSGVTITTDISGGLINPGTVHLTFGVMKFDDLAGLTTKADGGPDKFLRLNVAAFPGPSTIGVSAAADDIESTYPSFMFPGNPPGDESARLQWYMDNIKGDDASFGGYAGGARHLGVLEVDAAEAYFLDVTETVDAWIDGSAPNHGFGLWGVEVAGGQGDTFDLASIESSAFVSAGLVDAVPEPASILLVLSALLALAWRRAA